MFGRMVIGQQSERGGKINALGNAEQKPEGEELAGISDKTRQAR